METPDQSVYNLFANRPDLGITVGMNYADVLKKLLEFIPVQADTENASVSSRDVATKTPPEFMLNDYSKCWDKVGNQKGWYIIADAQTSRIFSYDFADAVSSLPANMEVRNISVTITVMESGVKKTLVNSNKVSNAISIGSDKFPIGLSASIAIGSSECGEMTLTASLSLGNVPVEKRFFAFNVRGSGSADSRYNLESVMDMTYAKMAQVTNFVNTIQSGDYLTQINLLKLQNDALIAKLGEKKQYVIGDPGLGQQVFTEDSFIAYVVNELKSLNSKLLKLGTT